MRLGLGDDPRGVLVAAEVGVGHRQRLEAQRRARRPGSSAARRDRRPSSGPRPPARCGPAIADARATAIAAHADRTLSSSRCVSPSASSAISRAAATSPAATASSARLRSIHAMLWVMPASRAASTPSSRIVAASASRPRMKCAAPSAGSSVGCRWPAARPSRSARSACAHRLVVAVEVGRRRARGRRRRRRARRAPRRTSPRPAPPPRRSCPAASAMRSGDRVPEGEDRRGAGDQRARRRARARPPARAPPSRRPTPAPRGTARRSRARSSARSRPAPTRPGGRSRLARSRACASSWRPSRRSTPAHVVVSCTRSPVASAGDERDALEQVGVALGEPALRGERAGAGEEQLDALLRRARSRASGAGRR